MLSEVVVVFLQQIKITKILNQEGGGGSKKMGYLEGENNVYTQKGSSSDQCATLCVQLMFKKGILAPNPGRVPCQVILLLNLP